MTSHSDSTELARSIRATSGLLAALLRSVSDPSARAVGSWSIEDTAKHLADVFANYPGYLDGTAPVFTDVMDITRRNAEVVARPEAADLDKIARGIQESGEEFAARVERSDPSATLQWHGGIDDLRLGEFVAIPITEALVHGFDIARASGQAWGVERRDAALGLDGILPLLPHYVDHAAAAGFSATYEIRIRGGHRHLLVFRDGNLAVQQGSGGRAECHISADPATFLLVGYRRIPQWQALAGGKIVAWGTKPWLGLKLPSLIRQP